MKLNTLWPLTALFLALAGAAVAQQWGDIATISPTTNLSAGHICYTDGRDISCDSSAPLASGLGSADRLTSGSTVVYAISNTGYISLTTAGSTWGYFGSAASYLPTLSSTKVSSTNISATAISVAGEIQVSNSGASCTSSLKGAIRYSDASSTLQLCTGASWTTFNQTSGGTYGLIPPTNMPDIISCGTAFFYKNLYNSAGGVNSVRYADLVGNYGYYSADGNTKGAGTGFSSCSSTVWGNTPYYYLGGLPASAGGADGQIQYNSGNVLTGSAALAFISSTNTVSITGKVSATNISATALTVNGVAITGAGASSMATLTDVSETGVATGMLLRYNGTKWESVGASTALSTTTMTPNFPDAIYCSLGGTPVLLYQDQTSGGTVSYQIISGAGAYYVRYSSSTGAYSTSGNMGTSDCVTNAWSISQLYTQGKAFNFIGTSSSNGTSTALGDQIVSGSLVAVANSATSYISLTTAGSTWGYLSSLASYLPNLSSNKVSATNISATALTVNGVAITGSGGGGSTGSCTPLSYTTGDRRSSIVATADGSLLYAGYNDPNKLLDGSNSNDTFFPTASATGHYLRFQFTAATVVTEAQWVQSGAFTHGTWQWQGSNDGSTWTNIGATFTLGGSTTQTITTLNGNTTAYIYYQMVGTGGSTSGSPYLYETNFKQCSVGATTPGGATTNLQYNNAGGFAGDSALTWASNTAVLGVSGTTSATNVYAKNISTTNLVVGGITVTGGGSSGDRISTSNVASGSNLGMVVASAGTVSFTLGGTAGAAYLHPTLGFVGPGVSTTGVISGTGIFASGNMTATAYLHSSDERLKTNITTFPNAMGLLKQLRGVHFNWKSSGLPSNGVIAQEVQKILPEAVSGGGSTTMVVDYDQLIAPLIEAVKEQQQQIDDLRTQLKELRNQGH
ncbi:MAG: hypothetical protein GC129_02215 [Proteobacteria bacterium]|nr:hypothetical protein [Pseudomonadota bacterium]